MEFGHQRKSKQRLLGVGAVVALHVLVLYALVTGLARKAVEVLPAPIETKIIEELTVKEEPPPPPPPPDFKPPPPNFVPPPEIVIATPPPPPPAAITAVTTEPPLPGPPPVPAPVSTSVRTDPVIKARNCREPEYPPASQRLGEHGTVMLAMLVGIDGKVSESRVQSSSGYPRLDEAARLALSRCRFTPGTADGEPASAWAKIKYVWRLPK